MRRREWNPARAYAGKTTPLAGSAADLKKQVRRWLALGCLAIMLALLALVVLFNSLTREEVRPALAPRAEAWAWRAPDSSGGFAFDGRTLVWADLDLVTAYDTKTGARQVCAASARYAVAKKRWHQVLERARLFWPEDLALRVAARYYPFSVEKEGL